MKVIDFDTILKLNLSPSEMYEWTETVWKEQDEFLLEAKTSIWQGKNGRYMTMPCVLPKYNVAGVKFISRNIDDVDGIPLRNSNIMLQQIDRHGLLAVMDATYITTMRTGACAAYNAINFSKRNFKTIAVYGLGLTARAFMIFFAEKINDPITVKILKYKDQAEKFIERFKEYKNIQFLVCNSIEELFDSDIIVSCVSFAHNEIAPDSYYKKGVTIIPIHTSGFQNCDLFFDKIIIDDINHVKKYRYYDQFKNRMIRITDVANNICQGRVNEEERIIVYNGGLAITDIFWAYKINNKIKNRCPIIPMAYPEERFWL